MHQNSSLFVNRWKINRGLEATMPSRKRLTSTTLHQRFCSDPTPFGFCFSSLFYCSFAACFVQKGLEQELNSSFSGVILDGEIGSRQIGDAAAMCARNQGVCLAVLPLSLLRESLDWTSHEAGVVTCSGFGSVQPSKNGSWFLVLLCMIATILGTQLRNRGFGQTELYWGKLESLNFQIGLRFMSSSKSNFCRRLALLKSDLRFEFGVSLLQNFTQC